MCSAEKREKQNDDDSLLLFRKMYISFSYSVRCVQIKRLSRIRSPPHGCSAHAGTMVSVGCTSVVRPLPYLIDFNIGSLLILIT